MNGLRKWIRGILILACIVCMSMPVSAQAKVTKVVLDKKYSSNYEVCTLLGQTRDGKTVWKYKCGKNRATELTSVSFKQSGNYVYVIDGKSFLKLKLQTGKKAAVNKKAFAEATYSATMYIDGSGNLYASGYYSDMIYKLSPKGKRLWQTKVKESCYWPYKMKCSGNRLKVFYEGEGSPDVVLKTSNGKIIKYQ